MVMTDGRIMMTSMITNGYLYLVVMKVYADMERDGRVGGEDNVNEWSGLFGDEVLGSPSKTVTMYTQL